MKRRLRPLSRIAAAWSCTHFGHAGNRAEAVALYRAGRLSYSRYIAAFTAGAEAAREGRPCPCQLCREVMEK